MHYSNGNYEAFVNASKPKDVDQKSAYIVGSGLAALASAVFLIRDGHMKGERIHIFEELGLPGGSMDGIYNKQKKVTSSVVVVKWSHTLNVCGTYLDQFHHQKTKTNLSLMNFTA